MTKLKAKVLIKKISENEIQRAIDNIIKICYNIYGEQGQFFYFKIKGLLVSGKELNCSLLTTLNEALFI